MNTLKSRLARLEKSLAVAPKQCSVRLLDGLSAEQVAVGILQMLYDGDLETARRHERWMLGLSDREVMTTLTRAKDAIVENLHRPVRGVRRVW